MTGWEVKCFAGYYYSVYPCPSLQIIHFQWCWAFVLGAGGKHVFVWLICQYVVFVIAVMWNEVFSAYEALANLACVYLSLSLSVPLTASGQRHWPEQSHSNPIAPQLLLISLTVASVPGSI